MKKVFCLIIAVLFPILPYGYSDTYSHLLERQVKGTKWIACAMNGNYMSTYYFIMTPNERRVDLEYPEDDMKYYKLNIETGEYERVEYILDGTVDPETLREFYIKRDRFGESDGYVYIHDLKTHKDIGKLDCGGKWLADYASVDHKIRKVFVSCYIGGCYNDISNPEPCRWKKVVFDADTLKKAWESETWLDACRGERYEGKEEGTLYCKSSKGNKMLKVRVDYDKGKWEVVKELDVPTVGQIKNGVGMHAEEELVDEDGKVYNSYQEIRDKLWDSATGTYKKSVFRKFTVYLYDMETGALIKKVSYPEKIIYPDSVGVRLMPDGNRFYGIYGRSERWKKEKVNGKGTKFKWVKISGERWEKLWVVDIEKNINKLYDINIDEETVKKEPKVVHLCSDSSCVVYRAGDELIWIDLDKGKITKRIKIKYPEECRK